MLTERDATLQRRLAQGALALGAVLAVVQAMGAVRCSAAVSALDAAPGLAALAPGVVRLVQALAVISWLEVAAGAAMALSGLRLLRTRRGLGGILLTAYAFQALAYLAPLYFERAAAAAAGGLQLSGAELADAGRAALHAAVTGRALGLCTIPAVFIAHRLRRLSH